ncbi:molybdopterin-dependent oxidoreductase [Subtercola endophyticus]|uniref:molybdopterin-dependent oxidoreductase n=1 Tax=Subtercola endophyticus TaxID=2895559 RepID=UPI001E513B6F|nr:molybdopterin-dependent oxidoreductase [Subtercola endophyticus]UFS59716.1 molybdopterin-dependent oxidoreductase [Subtercola endophyticus]
MQQQPVRRLLLNMQRAVAAPTRNPRLAVVLGRLLATAFLICFATGLYSHFLQQPLPWMRFPTWPANLYQVTQGIHITAGIACFPLIFGKLYTVFPNLFQTPPVTGLKGLLERGSIALFVGASLVEIVIGLLNTYQFYPWPFGFRETHFALSFVIIGSLAIHIGVKLPIIATYWRKRDGYAPALAQSAEEQALVDAPLIDAVPPALQAAPGVRQAAGLTGRLFRWIDSTPSLDDVAPEDVAPEEVVAEEVVPEEVALSETAPADGIDPDLQSDATEPQSRASVSRRAFLITIGASVAAVVLLTAGQSFAFLRPFNVFAPREKGIGPNQLPINRTAAAAQVTKTAVDPAWVLTVSNGSRSQTFSRASLLALPQTTVDLPISCVEGWSQMATWSGVRLQSLVAMVGASPDSALTLTSLEKEGGYRVTQMGSEYVSDPTTLVALTLNGETLDIDHGFPARMIAPGRPGVLQTKWLSSLEVTS